MGVDKSKLLIIDGHALIFRAYYAFQSTNLKNSKTGLPSGAVFGFFRMFFKLLTDYPCSHLIFTFDPGTPLERATLYPEYKANRKPVPPELIPQIIEVMDIVRELGYPLLVENGQEADDLIGSLCKKFYNFNEILILSGDKDLYQLLTRKNIKMLRGKKGTSDFIIIDSDWVISEVGVKPEEITDYMGIVGDTSDNIPGVKGIGDKGAATLIKEYHSLEEIYANIDTVKNNNLKNKLLESRDKAFLSRKLATLNNDLKIQGTAEDYILKPLSEDKINIFSNRGYNVIHRDLLKEYGLKQEKKDSKIVDVINSSPRGNYKQIKSLDELKELLKNLNNITEISVDTETTSKSALNAIILGVSLSWKEEEGVYIPIKYTGTESGANLLNFISENEIQKDALDLKSTLQILKPFLENKNIKKIGQNIKYDYLVLSKYDIHLYPIYFDTMIAGYLLKPDIRRHGMDDMALDYLNYKTITYDELTGTGKKRKNLFDVELSKVTEYAAEDADITFRLYKKLSSEIEIQDPGKILFKIEIPLIEVLAEMEKTGIKINREYFSTLSDDFKKEIQAIEKNIFKGAKKEFNINSTKELQKVLFEDLNLDAVKKNKTGLSTDHRVLELLKGKHEIIDFLLEHRKFSKLLGTYVDPLPTLIHPITGRIHTSYNQTIAATGRLSSTDPNLQNIPIKDKEGRMIRKGFVAEEGYQLLSLDYSQIELRIMAHVSEDRNMIEAYEKGLDIHARTASALFGVIESDVTPEMRNKAKVVNFSVIYGTTAYGLAENLKIEKREAAFFIDRYFSNYPGVREYMDKISTECFEKGYVETIYGRRRYIPEIKSTKRQEVEGAKRIAINSPIQGTSADLIKAAMIEIHSFLQKKKCRSRLLLQVHDELVFEVHNSERELIYDTAKKIMETIVQLKVPLETKGKFGDNWDEAH